MNLIMKVIVLCFDNFSISDFLVKTIQQILPLLKHIDMHMYTHKHYTMRYSGAICKIAQKKTNPLQKICEGNRMLRHQSTADNVLFYSGNF